MKPTSRKTQSITLANERTSQLINSCKAHLWPFIHYTNSRLLWSYNLTFTAVGTKKCHWLQSCVF